MARYQILSWSDIPVGVKAVDDEGSAREELPSRFQNAVDAVATATGRTGTEAYLAAWVWADTASREGSAGEVAAAVAAELEASHPPSRIKDMKKALIEQLGAPANDRGLEEKRSGSSASIQTEGTHHG